jgi:septum formation protein
MSILLASGSPQRSAILKQLGLPFRVIVPGVEELEMGDPSELAVENARRKADAVADQAGTGELILACDTVVDVDGIPFGKPENAEEAFTMLALLRHRSHDVVGGLAIVDPASGKRFERAVRTKVRFRNFPDALLERYVASEEWRGHAGGYAIQSTGAALVSGIGGCYQNVVGLPVAMLLLTLEDTSGWDELARSSS